MHYENTLKFTLLASVLIHGFLLLQLPALNTSGMSKAFGKIEVSYYKLQKPSLKARGVKAATVRYSTKENPAISKKVKTPSPAARDAADFFKKPASTLKNQVALKQLHPQKRISFPEVKSDSKIKNPKYVNYYQTVRDKIRRCAYDNYTRYDTGEVYLVFVVLKDGSLKDAKIIDEKSVNSNYLKETALRSVREAGPYPVFPEELAYPELSFNVIISFEVSD